MTLRRLLLRNLVYHWRGNVAMFLGVLVGASVLTGALFVGDSLRGNLLRLSQKQLEWVDHVLIPHRYFRQKLADCLEAERACPVLLLQGSASSQRQVDQRRLAGRLRGRTDSMSSGRHVSRVTILGVDDRFWPDGTWPESSRQWPVASGQQKERLGTASTTAPPNDSVILSEALAQQLGAKPGDLVTLYLPRPGAVPADSPFGEREMDELPLRVASILSADSPGGRFSLGASTGLPRNAFVPLSTLQASLTKDTVNVTSRVNALFARGDTAKLDKSLAKHLELADWGLKLRWSTGTTGSCLSLQSEQLLLEPVAAQAALSAAQQVGMKAAPTLVYLADHVTTGKSKRYYVLVAAVDPGLAPPLEPLLPDGVAGLKDDEIAFVRWRKPLLHDQPGDTVTLSYYAPDDQDQLRTAIFKLKTLLPLAGAAADSAFTPELPGVTDRTKVSDWNPPPQLHFDAARLKMPDDDDYWKEHRTAPRAYIALKKGQELWSSRFGQLTSIRMVAPAHDETEASTTAFTKALLSELESRSRAFRFDPVGASRQQASAGGTDFGGLFLGFSLFLIVAALLLVGLLFRLNVDRRAPEIGLLLATGYRLRTVRWFLLLEGGVISAVGALAGLAGGLGYAWLMLRLLQTWWPGALDHSLMQLHTFASSYVIGYLASLLTSLLTIVWAVRILSRWPVTSLLRGQSADDNHSAISTKRPLGSVFVSLTALAAAISVAVLAFRVEDHDTQALAFFGAGTLFLTAMLAAVRACMTFNRHGRLAVPGRLALVRMGVRNAARHLTRSMLTVGLLACAVFVLVAVQSFRREPGKDLSEARSGTGGYTFLAETEGPVYLDPNTDKGRDELLEQVQIRLQDQGLNSEQIAPCLAQARKTLEQVRIDRWRLRRGDDVSCLNLYQPVRPRLLGVPRQQLRRGGFTFTSHEGAATNPWELLSGGREDDAIPVFADATTAQYVLRKKLGEVIEVPDERGDPRKLRLVGLLKESIFQGELLMAETYFLQMYPNQSGYNFLLVAASPEQATDARELLEMGLGRNGVEIIATADRLKTYLQVENTYLAMFQVLGGLGLLLGTIGLAVVLLRSVWERRGELALLRALGYRRSALACLLLAENGFLLSLAVAVGMLAAFFSVAPYLLGGMEEVPWSQLLGMLALVLVVGIGVGGAATAASLRAPLLPALRQER